MRKLLPILLLTAAILLPAADLWKKGEPTLPIVVSVESPEPARQAAYELAQWLDKATGETWMVTAKAPAEGQKALYVGPVATLGQSSAPADLSALPHDGFWCKIAQDGLHVAGRDYPGGSRSIFMHPMRDVECWNPDLRLSAFGDMGTWYGVHHFLEKLGFRWYAPGDLGTVVPELTAISLPDQEETIAPAFEYRYAWLCNFPADPKDALWYRRVGFGAPTPVNIIHSYWMMTEKYGETRPEFFALVDGKRDTTNGCAALGGGQPCLSNPEVCQAWIDYICDFFQENPDQDLFPLCPNDGLLRICECPECQAQLSLHLGKHGKFSNYIWTFSNKVARGVAERMPGKRVGTFAYESYREVPDCLTELAPNLAVMICYTRQELRNPAKKENIRGLIEGWSKLTDGLYFWTYPHKDYWQPWRCFPRFYPQILVEDIRENYRLHAKGEFLESESHNWNEPEFSGYDYHWPMLYHLTAYVTVKLLWDPNIDVDALLDDYYTKFYGPAAKEMKAFWKAVEASTMAGEALHPTSQFTPQSMNELLQMLKNAMALCPEETIYYDRIQELLEEMTPACEPLVHLAEREPMRVPYIEDDILPVDGTLWPQAKKSAFVDKYGLECKHQTDCLVAADKEGLAFTFLCYEKDMPNLHATATKRDQDKIWSGDCVEFQYCPADNKNGKTLIIDPNGFTFDAQWATVDDTDDLAWTPELKVFAKTEADKWIIQVKIPWKEFGYDSVPSKGQFLLGNLYRDRPTQKFVTEYSAYTPTYTHQHRIPQVFVPIILE